MGGIMIPITMSEGIERARKANREDERFEMEKEKHGLTMKGLELGNQQKGFEFEQAQKDAPLKDLERKAKTTAELAKHGFVMLSLNQKNPKTKVEIPEEWGQAPQIPEDWGYVTDENAPHVTAKVLTDSPLFGPVTVLPNGWLSDGESVFQATSRQDYIDLMYAMAFPEKAMELARREQQYINEKGQVETMTAGEAKGRGLEMATDKMAGYTMNKARIEDQYAEENARVGLDTKKVQLGNAQREANEKGREQFVSPDGKTVRTMSRSDGLEMGWTPYKDFEATKKLPTLGSDGYDFSKQTPDAIRKGIFEQSMMDKGYTPVEEFTATGATVEWKTPDGKPVPPEEVRAANDLADEALGVLSEGAAKDPVDAMRKVKAKRSTPPVAGARQAKDGNWYVQKNGKWFRVRQ